MSIPFVQQFRMAAYIIGQRLRGVKRYPLVLMLEPLFRCNLACAGCGKIDYPKHILDRQLSVEECLAAVDACGAPVVSIAGGEPLIHKDIPEIVRNIVARRKFVYLCTNGLLLKKRMHEFEPTPYLAFSVHLDGLRARHDASVCRQGVFDKAVEVIKLALKHGFRVTVNCTLFQGESADDVEKFMDFAMSLGIEGVTISPGYGYQHAPAQEVFLRRAASKRLFRDIFRRRRGKGWRFNHSPLFLDFLAGNQSYKCTPWGSPTRNVFGWQKPCYLLVDEGYAASFRELMEETRWDDYGVGRNAKCADCMVHCGYEPTAVNDALAHPLKALRSYVQGPRTCGPFAPEPAAAKDEVQPDQPPAPAALKRWRNDPIDERLSR